MWACRFVDVSIVNASVQLAKVAESLASKGRGLAGRMLNLSPR